MPSELATRVRAKFPGAYDDIDDATLEKNVLAKHPEYQDLATPYVPDSPLAHHLNEQEGSGDWGQNLANAGQSLAHPQTLSDIGNLIAQPVDATRSAGAKLIGRAAEAIAPKVGPAVSAVGRGVESVGKTFERPGKYVGAWEMLTDPIKGATMIGAPPLVKMIGRGVQRLGAAMTPAADTAAEAVMAGPHMDLSQPIRPGSLTQQQILERMRAVQQAGGTSIPPTAPKTMLGGRLQMMPTERPPMTVAPESPMQPPSPMQQPRVQVGAEVVGRQNGLTTQQVRDTTGPIRGEAQGAAAGMPNGPMDRIVQKLIDMGPKGQGLPETARESYAAAGTSDKTRVQVQAYLDALRKVGFVGAGAASADAIRQAVMKRLQGEQQ